MNKANAKTAIGLDVQADLPDIVDPLQATATRVKAGETSIPVADSNPAPVISRKPPNMAAGGVPTMPGGSKVSRNGSMGVPTLINNGSSSSSKAKAEDAWKRKTKVDGRGACHVKSFHAKLAEESLEYLDQQINAWLDEHPDCEVKLVTNTIGEWCGKTREPHLVCQIWL